MATSKTIAADTSVLASAKDKASASWDAVCAAASHPTVVSTAKVVGGVVAVGVAYAVVVTVANKTYALIN